jgi:ElaB/YqjD/DUF883 family membrane-anchored ribosome-binding protein
MATYNTTTPGMGSTPSTTTPSTSMSGQSTPAKTAETMADKVEEKASGATTVIGERLERAGDFLEEKGKAAFLSDRLHSAGKYLQDNDARTMVRTVDSAINAHPYRGILIGLGIGWVVGKFLSRD